MTYTTSDADGRYKNTALSVLSDIASEVVQRAREGRDTAVSEDDQQRLFNATMAAVQLGATQGEVAAALRSGFREGGAE